MKKPILTALLFLSCYGFIHAQDKLPSVQKGNFRAPSGIHIDGSLADWKDSLRAYNRSTKIYYLLANDDKYLYLAVRATDATTKAKIAAGGITLTINTSGKKKEQDAFSLTYPVISHTAGRGNRRGGGGGASSLTDSASKQQLILAAKEIKVIGFKDVDDTLISIYNEYSIKVAIGFDLSSNYCYELAVPLKLLGLNADDAKEFAYNIKLNGLQTAIKMINISGSDGGGGAGLTISGDGGGGSFRSSGGGGSRGGGAGGGRGGRGGAGGGNNTIDYEDLTSPTDFWGNYALAKK